MDYIANHLTSQGKAGIIVPDGVVFKKDKAFVSVRKDLVENSLWAVLSLPGGIFQPYAGVSTNILFLDKKLAKETDSVLFCELKNDGFTLSTQRKPIDGSELEEFKNILLNYKNNFEVNNDKFSKISKKKLADNDYDLSAAQYLKRSKVNKSFKSTEEIMNKLIKNNEEYISLLNEIKELR